MPKSRSITDLIEDVVDAVTGAPTRRRPARRRSSSAKAPPTRRSTARKPAATRKASPPSKPAARRKPAARKPSAASKPAARRKPAARKPSAASKPAARRKPAARPASPRPKPSSVPAAARKPPAKPRVPRSAPPVGRAPRTDLAQIGVCVSPDEARLIEAINAYRAEAGLPPIAVSRALTQVARLHVRDLALYHPDRGRDVRGQPGNMHSWSGNGPWQPVCYTDDHAYAKAMWSKPREISGGAYRAYGYEIAFESSGRATAAGAIDAWRGSAGHSDVVLERGVWAGKRWPALGVGLYGSYAVAWFGEDPDPQGEPEPCVG